MFFSPPMVPCFLDQVFIPLYNLAHLEIDSLKKKVKVEYN
jgi:hypothetical protein